MNKERKFISEILLRRRNKIIVPTNDKLTDNIGRVAVMMKNVQSIGFTFSKELIEELRYCNQSDLDALYLELIGYLKYYVGADKEYNFMYPNFPNQVFEANEMDLFINAVVHYLSAGTLFPQYEKDERLPLFDNPDLKVLDVGSEAELAEIMNNLIGSKTSLSQQDKDDLVWLLNNVGFNYSDMPEINFKENLPIISKLILDNQSEVTWFNSLKTYYKTATDVLRLAVYLSDGDVSLATKTKFKSMPRKIRRLIVQLLDNCGNIEEDMLRHKTAWIMLGEYLHAGEYQQYRKVQVAFDKLRNGGRIETFGGKVTEAIQKTLLPNAVVLLKKRPGEFARKLDFLLRNFKEWGFSIIENFEDVAKEVSVPVLLQVREHFIRRNEKNDSRVFFPKGTLAKVYTIENNLEPIGQKHCDSIVSACDNAIIDQFKAKEPLGKVYVADCLKNYCVPQSQRSASKVTTKVITRGSRLPLRNNVKAARAFIYWTNMDDTNGNSWYSNSRVDIDLSAAILDENFGYLEHVSYTNLRSDKYKACHSGDITNGFNGSSEFLDVDVDSVVKYGGRYVIYQVYSYTGQKFGNMPNAMFGFMEREDVNSGEVYEAKTVEQKMDLTADSTVCIPVIFDCVKREFIWLDVAMNISGLNRSCANLEKNLRGASAICYGIVNGHKPNMFDLAILNAVARGTLTLNRNDADVIFDTDLTKPVEIITKHIEVQNEKGEVIDTRIETEEKIKDCRIISPWDIDIWVGEML